MKRFTPLAKLLALAVALAATPAFAGPDFVTGDRAKPLAASDARGELQPMDDVVFTYDDASLRPTAQAQLVSAARWLDHHPDDLLVLEG